MALSHNLQYAEDFATLWNFDRIMRLLHYSNKNKSKSIAVDVEISPQSFLKILSKYCNIKEITIRDFTDSQDFGLDHYLSV